MAQNQDNKAAGPCMAYKEDSDLLGTGLLLGHLRDAGSLPATSGEDAYA